MTISLSREEWFIEGSYFFSNLANERLLTFHFKSTKLLKKDRKDFRQALLLPNILTCPEKKNEILVILVEMQK